MKIDELLIESYDTSKARIEHAEDLIFTSGSKGATRAVFALEQAATNPSKVSIKPDGRPAIKWGKDLSGFVMGDKYMNPLPHSIEELTSILQGRKGGGRENLIKMYQRLWSVFESSVPSIDGYLFGDLMYSTRPEIRGNSFVMRPNTVEYKVPVQSPLGQAIANSVAGIVVHTYLPAESQIGQHITDLTQIGGIRPQGALLMISDTMPKVAPVNISTNSIAQAIQKYGPALNAFLSSMPATFGQLAKKFANTKVKQQNFDNMANEFIEWVQVNAGSSMVNTINTKVRENPSGYMAMWAIFTLIANVKNKLVDQLDQTHGQMTATINGQPGQEGYLVHTQYGPIKLVNRFRFSAANFAKDK